MTHEEYCKKLDEYSAMFLAAVMAESIGDESIIEVCERATLYADALIEMQNVLKSEKKSQLKSQDSVES